MIYFFYVQSLGKKWDEIARNMPGRNASQCSQRWRRRFKPEKVRTNWSKQEDHQLLVLYEKYGSNWQMISKEMIGGHRTGKQVRERYLNKLDPKIKKTPWADYEDQIIIRNYQKIGKKWSEISKKLEGRPENTVKNRFYSCLRKKINVPDSDSDSENEKEYSHEGSAYPSSSDPSEQNSISNKNVNNIKLLPSQKDEEIHTQILSGGGQEQFYINQYQANPNFRPAPTIFYPPQSGIVDSGKILGISNLGESALSQAGNNPFLMPPKQNLLMSNNSSVRSNVQPISLLHDNNYYMNAMYTPPNFTTITTSSQASTLKYPFIKTESFEEERNVNSEFSKKESNNEIYSKKTSNSINNELKNSSSDLLKNSISNEYYNSFGRVNNNNNSEYNAWFDKKNGGSNESVNYFKQGSNEIPNNHFSGMSGVNYQVDIREVNESEYNSGLPYVTSSDTNGTKVEVKEL